MKSLKEKTLLYVEDEPAILEQYTKFFCNYFFHVFTAEDGLNAKKVYEDKKPDVIILDINLPKINGITLVKYIREKDRKTPIVLLTARSDKETLKSAIELDITTYLEKPITRNALKETLEKPRFDAKDFQRIKKQRLQSINNQKSNPSFLAGVNYNKAVYGKSILATPANGTYSTVNKISVDDCKSYYDNFYSPNVASLSILGPVTQTEIMGKLFKC